MAAVIAQVCMQLRTYLGLTKSVAAQRQQDNGPTSLVDRLS